MKSVLFFVMTVSLGASAMAQTSSMPALRTSAEIGNSCRIQAKEAAALAYRSCVDEVRTSQIEQIKKDYQRKLLALKAQYEAELRKMNAAKAGNAGNAGDTGNTGAGIDEKSSLRTSDLRAEMPAPPASELASETALAAASVDAEIEETVVKGQENMDDSEVTKDSEGRTEMMSGTASSNETPEDKLTTEATVPAVAQPAEKKPVKKAQPQAKPALEATAKAPAKSVAVGVHGKKKKAKVQKPIPAALKASPKKASSSRTGAKTGAKLAPKNGLKKMSASLMPVEMTVRLKPAPRVPMKDESTMDLPEPIPLESFSEKSPI